MHFCRSYASFLFGRRNAFVASGFLPLRYQTGWELAFFLQTLVATVLLVLGLNGTLPLPTTTTIAGIPPEQYPARNESNTLGIRA